MSGHYNSLYSKESLRVVLAPLTTEARCEPPGVVFSSKLTDAADLIFKTDSDLAQAVMHVDDSGLFVNVDVVDRSIGYSFLRLRRLPNVSARALRASKPARCVSMS